MEELNDADKRPNKRPVTETVKQQLDADNMSQSLWLVKIPQYVSEQWMNAKHDQILGSLMVGMKAAPTNNAPPVKQLIVKLDKSSNAGPVSENAPDVFTLDDRLNNDDSVLAFNIDNKSKKFRVEGKVTKTLAMRPFKNQNYHKLVQERNLLKLSSRKEVKLVDSNDLEKSSNQITTVEFLTSTRGDMKRKSAQLDGASGDGVDAKALRNKMFESFEKSDKQSFETILTICSQVPSFTKEQDLRDLLDQYAKYHNKGPYKHLWELKPEYRGYGGNEEDQDDIDNQQISTSSASATSSRM